MELKFQILKYLDQKLYFVDSVKHQNKTGHSETNEKKPTASTTTNNNKHSPQQQTSQFKKKFQETNNWKKN